MYLYVTMYVLIIGSRRISNPLKTAFTNLTVNIPMLNNFSFHAMAVKYIRNLVTKYTYVLKNSRPTQLEKGGETLYQKRSGLGATDRLIG